MKVSELEGSTLDSWVAKALGVEGRKVMRTALVGSGRGHKQEWYEIEYPAYSTLWADGGPLIERERIHIFPVDAGGTFIGEPQARAGWLARVHGKQFNERGPTPLIAAMRALVASKFGEEVADE